MANKANDPVDLFRISLGDAAKYPQNLVNKHEYGHRLDALDALLSEEQDRVWDPDTGVVEFLDMFDGDDGARSIHTHMGFNELTPPIAYSEMRFETTTDLDGHFEGRDPRCRYTYVFMVQGSSRRN